jgi:hypothetical protein
MLITDALESFLMVSDFSNWWLLWLVLEHDCYLDIDTKNSFLQELGHYGFGIVLSELASPFYF